MPEPNELDKETGELLEGWREPYGPWKVDPVDGLSEFEAAVLEEVLNTPSSASLPGDPRLVTQDEWLWTIAGNA